MEAYFRSNGKVFEIEYFDRYRKEDAIKLQQQVKNEEDMDTLKLKGKNEVREIRILKDRYSKKAVTISKAEVTRLYKFIAEIEAKDCETTLNEYYS